MTALQISPDREFWETVMDEIEASDFLSGRAPSRERPDWRLTLDYLLTTNRKTGVEMAVMIHDGAFRARKVPQGVKALMDWKKGRSHD